MKRPAAKYAIPLVVLVAATGLWLTFRPVDWALAWQAVRGADFTWVVLAAALNLFTIFFLGSRLYQFLSAIVPIRLRTGCEAVSLGFFGGLFLPFRAGELLKLHVMYRAGRVDASTGVGMITLEQVFNLMGLLAVAGLVFVLGTVPVWLEQVTLGGVLLLPFLLFFLYRLQPGGIDESRHPIRYGLQRFRNRLHIGLTPLRKPRIFSAALLLTLAAWGVELLMAYAILLAFGIEGGFELAMLLLLAVNLITVVPITPGQVGVYELAAVFVLRQGGVDPSTAAMIALVYRLSHVLPTVLVALTFLLTPALRVRSVA